MSRREQQQQTQNFIRSGAAVIVVIIVGYYFWQFGPHSSAALQATTPACQLFDSITAAPQYSSPAPIVIDTSKTYVATIVLAKGGEIQIELLADKAPMTVNNFMFLACKKFYDGLTFHRVIQGFMAQGGDPTGTGSGGPGYQFKNEDSDLKFDAAGIVAMANAGRDTNGSQFFITVSAQEKLNGGYTIFGRVTSGLDLVKSLKLRDPQQNPNFSGDVIATIKIFQE